MVEVFSAKKVKKRGKVKKKQVKQVEKRQQKADVVVREAKRMLVDLGQNSGLGSLAVLPKGVAFEAQKKKEVIILLMRRHIITNLGWLTLASLLMFVPFFWGDFPLMAMVNEKTRFALAVVWYLGLGFYVLENLLLWYYSVYIVTDERIVDVDFFELFYKNVDVTQIRNVEDVNYSQVGIFTSIFNYGDVVVQTASEQRPTDPEREISAFTFEAVPNPNRVVRVISELMEQEEQESYEGRTR